MRQINEIIVHCTATRPNWWQEKTTSEKVAEIRRWHVEERKWADIGYHYLIDRNGAVAKGRPISKAGAHTKNRNANTVAIALFGGHGSSENDRFADHFTPEQESALRSLLHALSRDYGVTKVSGHNQYAAKACPGFNAPRWLANAPAPEQRTSPTQSRTVQASAMQIAGGASGAVAAFGALDGAAQIVAIAGCVVIVGLAMWIMRERLKAWAAGWR